MAENPRLAGVKTLLRSVLQSVKEGVPAHRLAGDFYNITGEPLAYKAMGFNSVEAMVAAIPDTVRQEWDNSGQKVYKAVADESTAHIEKMVSRQRSNKKRSKGGTSHMRRPAMQMRRAVRPKPASTRSAYHEYKQSARTAQGSYTHSMSGYGNRESTSSSAPKSGNTKPVLKRRNVEESPKGSVRITVQRTPPHTKTADQRNVQNVMKTPGNENIKFGDNYKVPPRFQRLLNQKSPSPVKEPSKVLSMKKFSEKEEAEVFNDSHKYVAILDSYSKQKGLREPQYETIPTSGGHVAVVTVCSHTHGSGGIYKTKEDAKESAARAACRSLKCIKAEEPRRGDPMYSSEDVPGRQLSSREYSTIRERVKQLVQRRPNGLWCSRLPVEYKEKYREELPAGIFQLLEEWTDIVEVQGQTNLKILYPVQEKSIHIEKARLPGKGTSVTVYLSFVVDVSRFYVHLEDSQIQEVMAHVNSLATKSSRLRGEELVAGRYVAAQCTDDYWYRAQIVSVTPKHSKSEVFYVDFGNNEELSNSRLRVMQRDMAKWPIQMVRCSLPDPHLHSDDTVQKLDEYKDSTMKMTVIDAQNDVCIVQLYDESGNKLFDIKPPKVDDPEPLELPNDDQWDVVVSHIVSGNQVILRLVDQEYSEKLSALEELIAENGMKYADYEPELGDLCAALITTSTAEDDNPWYRVRVAHIEGDKVLCEYLDYGDTEVVQPRQLRPLLPAEAELPYQAVIAYLTGLDGQEDNDAVVKELTRMVLNRGCVANINSRDGDPSITLYDTTTAEDININEVITEVINIRDLKPQLPKDEEMSEGFVSFIDQDGSIFLQLQGPGLVKLEALTKKVTDVYSKGGAEYFVKDLKEGRLVMALFRDGGWYRSLIRRILSNRQVLVFFVDYGNEEVLQCTSLRELELASVALCNLPFQAVSVTLAGLPPAGFSWTENALAELGDRVPADQAVYIQTVLQDDSSAVPAVHLSLFDNNEFISINEEMAEPTVWLDLGPLSELDRVSEHDSEGKQTASEVGLNVTSGSEGEISDASIASQQASEVLLETEGLLRELGIPTQINSTEDIYTVSEDLSSKLAATTISDTADPDPPSAPGLQVLEATVQSHTSPPSTPSNKDLNSNETAKVIPQTVEEYRQLGSPPSGELPKSGTEVYITWALDPSNFTFVIYKQLDFCEEMMNSLAVFYYQEGDSLKVDVPEVGLLYAGLFAEDERWYRVCIKKVMNKSVLSNVPMVSALFVDFGLLKVMPVTSLRQLTAEFRQVPFQSIRATLAGVSPEAGIWSEDAIARFENLVLEKKFVAWIHSKDQSQPVPVTLVDDEVEGDEALIHKQLIAEGLAVSSPFVPDHSDDSTS